MCFASTRCCAEVGAWCLGDVHRVCATTTARESFLFLICQNLSRCVVKIRHYPKCGGESVGVLRFEAHFLCMRRFFEKGLLLETHAALLEALDSKRQLKTIR